MHQHRHSFLGFCGAEGGARVGKKEPSRGIIVGVESGWEGWWVGIQFRTAPCRVCTPSLGPLDFGFGAVKSPVSTEVPKSVGADWSILRGTGMPNCVSSISSARTASSAVGLRRRTATVEVSKDRCDPNGTYGPGIARRAILHGGIMLDPKWPFLGDRCDPNVENRVGLGKDGKG